MKKISRRNFLKVSGAMAAAGALAACGGSGASTPAASGAASTSTAASAAAAGEDKFASLGDFTMTVGHAQPEGNPRFVSMEQFAADVAEATNGHVKIEVYGNGQLGTEKEMLEQVVAGTVIINLCDAGGYRQFSNSKHAIKAPADLKGLKMRTNGMKTIDMTFQAMGATTTTIPYSDLYMGLKTGVADGQENPWVNVEGMKFYEVQKYFTEVNYQFHPDPFYVNAAWWNGLPEEYRDIITECATKMGEYNDELIDKNSSAAKQTIVDSGCEVYEPSADELKAFQTAVQSVYDQCVTEGICTADEIKEMQDIVAKA